MQGVNFRWYTLRAARDYSIMGTVQNQWNGDVEVYAQGEPENILLFEDYLNKGPALARVAELIKEEFEAGKQYSSFEII